MLNLYRLTKGELWLKRARDLAHAACSVLLPADVAAHSLYKGNLGVAVLLAELECPEWASMPFFEASRSLGGHESIEPGVLAA